MTVQTSEKMTFITRNGFREGVVHDVDLAEQFFAAYEATYKLGNLNGGMKEIMRNAVACLISVHDRLRAITGIGEDFPYIDTLEVEISPPSVAYSPYDRDYVAFVRGAVHDPFLYSCRDDLAGFQQGAVLNLRKAQYVMREIINSKIVQK